MRSTKAYAPLWATANSPSSFNFVACSGATTDTVINSQLGPLNSSTGLVSISIGGNDAGFASTMSDCVLSFDEATCLARVAEARTYIDQQLPTKLDRAYAAIRSHAPSAHVVVLGYPRLYQLNGSCSVGLTEAERSAINGAADELDTVIGKRAANAGFTFGDVRTAFTGHEICSSDWWIHSVTFPAITESYHPTATGQSNGYLPVFTSAAR